MAEEKNTKKADKAAAPATAKVAVKKSDEKLSFFKRVGKWFRDMRSELKKVVWPTPKQTIKGSLVAIVMIVVCAVVLWGFDTAASSAIEALMSIFAG